MSKWGKIPDDNELTSQLLDLSQKHFEGRRAVPVTVYDQNRPKGWALGRRLLRQYELPQNPSGWAELMQRLLGMDVASIEEIRRRNALLRWSKVHEIKAEALDEPTERLGSSEWRQAADSRQGLLVIERWREVTRWNPRRLCYEVVGKEKVYEVK